MILVIVNAWAIPVDVANYFGAFDDDSETSLVRTPTPVPVQMWAGLTTVPVYTRPRRVQFCAASPSHTSPLTADVRACAHAGMGAWPVCAQGPWRHRLAAG